MFLLMRVSLNAVSRNAALTAHQLEKKAGGLAITLINFAFVFQVPWHHTAVLSTTIMMMVQAMPNPHGEM